MPTTSHRRCQFRGEGCSGPAHAGHDTCAHCYFHYVKPALKAEREDMRRRRAIKRNQLSKENRALISEVDLKEPQIRPYPDTELWVAQDEEPRPITVEKAVRKALVDQEFDRVIDAGIDAGLDPNQIAGSMILKAALPDGLPFPELLKKEELITPTESTVRLEIIDAYVAGMTVNEIRRAYSIGMPHLYEILDTAGVPRRHPVLHQTSRKRKEEPMPNSLTSAANSITASPPNGTAGATPLTEWTVTYLVRRTETKTVAAKSFNDAAAAVEADGVEVVSVSKVVAS